MTDHETRDAAPETARAEPPRARRRAGAVALVAGGLIAGGVLAGTVSATADSADAGAGSSTESTAPTAPERNGREGCDLDETQSRRSDETLLTGETATRVEAAALAEYPGATILRVETDSDGVYEAHLVTADGERVTVEVGEDFTVTGVEEGGGPGGPDGARRIHRGEAPDDRTDEPSSETEESRAPSSGSFRTV